MRHSRLARKLESRLRSGFVCVSCQADRLGARGLASGHEPKQYLTPEDQTRRFRPRRLRPEALLNQSLLCAGLPLSLYVDLLDYEVYDKELSPELALIRFVCSRLDPWDIAELKVLAHEHRMTPLHLWLHRCKLRGDQSSLENLARSVVVAANSLTEPAYDAGLVTGIIESFGDFGQLEAAQDFVRGLAKCRRVRMGASEWIALLLLTNRMGDRDRFCHVLREMRRRYSDRELADHLVGGLRGRRDFPVDPGVLVDIFVREGYSIGDEATLARWRTPRHLQESRAIDTPESESTETSPPAALFDPDKFGLRGSLKWFVGENLFSVQLHTLWTEVLKAAAPLGTTACEEVLKGMEADHCPINPKGMYGVLKDLYDAGGSAAVSSIFEALNYDPKYVNTVVVVIGMKAAEASRDRGRAERIRKKLQGMDANNIVTIGAQMNVFAERGDVQSMEKILERMKRLDITPNGYILATIIKGYTNAKRYLSAVDRGRQLARQHAVAWDLYVYGAAIRALVHGEDFGGAEATVREMEAAGIPSNDWTKATLLGGYAKVGDIKAAEEIFESIKDKKDRVVVTSLIQAYSEGGQVDKVIETMEQAIRDKVKLDSPLYVVFMHALLWNGRIHDAVEAFKNLNAMDPKIQQLRVFNSLMHAFGTSNDDLGVELMKKTITEHSVMDSSEQAGLEFDLVTWTIIMKNYLNNSRPDLAIESFRDMRMRRIVPDAAAWRLFIFASEETGLLKEGMEELDDAFRGYFKEKPEEEPEVYSIAKIDIMSRLGELEQVIATMKNAKARNRVTSDLHISYVQGLLNLERKDLAEEALEDMMASDREAWAPRTRNDLMRTIPASNLSWLMNKLTVLGGEVTKSMEFTYLKKLSAAEQWEDALKFLEGCGLRGQTTSMYKYFIDRATEAGNKEVAESAMQLAKEQGIDVRSIVPSKVVDNPKTFVGPDRLILAPANRVDRGP